MVQSRVITFSKAGHQNKSIHQCKGIWKLDGMSWTTDVSPKTKIVLDVQPASIILLDKDHDLVGRHTPKKDFVRLLKQKRRRGPETEQKRGHSN